MVFKKAFNAARNLFYKYFQNYNAIGRADKLMESEIRPEAPRHPTTVNKLEEMLKSNPSIREEAHKVPAEHLSRLQEVKVGSTGENQEPVSKIAHELPENREAYAQPSYGFEEPKVIPEGKCSLRQALEFISSYQDDPKKWTAQAIADKYNLKVKDADNITLYFSAFHLYHNPKFTLRNEAMKVLGVTRVTTTAVKQKFAQIGGGKLKDETRKVSDVKEDTT